MARFEAYEVAIQIVVAVRRPMEAIRKVDAELAKQIRRAASSIPLNVVEGNRRMLGDRRHHWRIAAGSAAETRAALQVAAAWGYVGEADVSSVLVLLDRVLALLWRLTEKR